MTPESHITTELRQALAVTTGVLASHNATYALIGGLAASYRSQPRFTNDVDFLVKVSQLALPGLLEDLRNRGFNFDLATVIRDWGQHHMVVLPYHGIRVDWLKPLLPIYLHVLERAKEETWLDQPIRIASTEGLILLKLLAFRTQDQLDIENLVAASRGSLDLNWIKTEWQTVAGLEDPRMRRLLELTGEFGPAS